jgi:hypothetical protein
VKDCAGNIQKKTCREVSASCVPACTARAVHCRSPKVVMVPDRIFKPKCVTYDQGAHVDGRYMCACPRARVAAVPWGGP